MTYSIFLVIFLFLPIILFTAVVFFDRRNGVDRNSLVGRWQVGLSFLLIVFIAMIYTTPWDNYLVATRVWWYDATQVLGVTFGWVPIEEYMFFILQPILVGLWMLILVPRISPDYPSEEKSRKVRRGLTLASITVWILSLLLLAFGSSTITYLGLEIAWALPEVILQLVFGGDILWRYRRPILLTIVPLTLYLSLADAIAIQFGVWTINPYSSLNILLGGILPVEEFVFFLLTNSLVTFGLVLIWSPEGHTRLRNGWERLVRGNRMPVLTEEP